MREFGQVIEENRRDEIIRAARTLFDAAGPKREARASEFELDLEGDPIMVNEADMRWTSGRMRVAMTTQDARSLFNWLIEITSNIGEVDYFKHYLVLENEIVLAQRKVLTPIDDQEALVILADLNTAREQIS